MPDSLVALMRQELEQLDKLAVWQRQRGLPITGQALQPGADVRKLAVQAALDARRRYHDNPPPQRKSRPYWISEPYRLDFLSETAIEDEVKARIKAQKEQMRA
jgi:hypothetical protein